MIARTMALAAALLGGVTTSQLPEFAQQYRQRLGGAIDALTQVVEEFRADAAAHGLPAAHFLRPGWRAFGWLRCGAGCAVAADRAHG